MPLAALLGVAALTVTACGGDGSAAGSVFKPVKPGVLTVATALLPDALRAVEKRIFRHGFDGRVRTEVDQIHDAVAKAILTTQPSLVIVDDPTFDASPGQVPVLVVHGVSPSPRAVRLIAVGDETNGVAAEVSRRLAKAESKFFRGRRRTGAVAAKR